MKITETKTSFQNSCCSFNKILLVILMLIGGMVPAKSQNSPSFVSMNDGLFRNSVKMNLMNAAFSYPSFSYERRLNEHVGVQLEGVFRMGTNSNTASSGLSNSNRSISSFGLYPAVRYYFYANEKMKYENYFSAYYKYRSYQSVNDYSDQVDPVYQPIDYSVTYTETTNGAGLLLGVQSSMESHFVFDIFFGTQLQSSNGQWLFHDKDADLNGFKSSHSVSELTDPFSVLNSTSLRAGFTLGVRF